jgi:light-regulated signal transduction histidine kinase (bacteriophytochrome)
VESRWTLKKDSSGKAIGILVITRDITEKQKAEEELKSYSAKLERLNRELQDFAFIASHDLQEPLRKIVAFSDLLKNKYGDSLSNEGLDLLKRMQDAARRMSVLIRDLLDLSRVASREQPFCPTDLNEIVRGVLTDLEIRIERLRASVETENLETIAVDATQMRQLFQNLIGNSLKFHREDKQPFVRIYGKYAEAKRFYDIFVEDNGIGFDEMYLDRIFQPFQRLHGRSAYEGTGIGLAICRKIVERHGGSITAKSKPNVGSTFIIRLPVT